MISDVVITWARMVRGTRPVMALERRLRSQRCYAGETLALWEQALGDPFPQIDDGFGPLRMPPVQMPSDWLDSNGHVNESRYLQLFSDASGTLERHIGINSDYRLKCGAFYTVETHLSHLQELRAGDRVQVLTQILEAGEKRLHLFHVLTHVGDERPVAIGEQMLIHVDATSRRSRPVQGEARERLLELAERHAQLPRPERAGASITSRSIRN
ncbi:acyl-CoA thioesterase FadM [Bradyrhizobium sp. USDA 4341]